MAFSNPSMIAGSVLTAQCAGEQAVGLAAAMRPCLPAGAGTLVVSAAITGVLAGGWKPAYSDTDEFPPQLQGRAQ